jgi:hypothetical protein
LSPAAFRSFIATVITPASAVNRGYLPKVRKNPAAKERGGESLSLATPEGSSWIDSSVGTWLVQSLGSMENWTTGSKSAALRFHCTV